MFAINLHRWILYIVIFWVCFQWFLDLVAIRCSMTHFDTNKYSPSRMGNVLRVDGGQTTPRYILLPVILSESYFFVCHVSTSTRAPTPESVLLNRPGSFRHWNLKTFGEHVCFYKLQPVSHPNFELKAWIQHASLISLTYDHDVFESYCLYR